MSEFTPEQNAAITRLCFLAGAVGEDMRVVELIGLAPDPQWVVDALQRTVDAGIRREVIPYTRGILNHWRQDGRTEKPATASFAERDRTARRAMVARVWGTEHGVSADTVLDLVSIWNTFGVKFHCDTESDVRALAMGPLGRCPDDAMALDAMARCRRHEYYPPPRWGSFETLLRDCIADARRMAKSIRAQAECDAKAKRVEQAASPEAKEAFRERMNAIGARAEAADVHMAGDAAKVGTPLSRLMERVRVRDAADAACDGLIPNGDA